MIHMYKLEVLLYNRHSIKTVKLDIGKHLLDIICALFMSEKQPLITIEIFLPFILRTRGLREHFLSYVTVFRKKNKRSKLTFY